MSLQKGRSPGYGSAHSFRTTTFRYRSGAERLGRVIEHMEAEEEKEKLIVELQKALAEIKTLSGFLPICAHCKKIRDDKGYWQQIETYIAKHSDTQFSHGICQECAIKFYPDIIDEDGKVKKG